MGNYKRYHIETADAPPLVPQPHKFAVQIRKQHFFQMVLEMVSSSFKSGLPPLEALRATFKSRPCIYGVYDSPVGGLMARPSLCRGCMRCMVEHSQVASIKLNPEYRALGDGYWKPEQLLTLWNEAADGKVPVKGAGYGGLFKGPGFDGIWTDMSEIVRPTRDGIHGREFISTAVDIGRKPMSLAFQGDGAIQGDEGSFLQIPLPFIFESLPSRVIGKVLQGMLIEAASRIGSLCLLPAEDLSLHPSSSETLVPVYSNGLPPENEGSERVSLWREGEKRIRMVEVAERAPAGPEPGSFSGGREGNDAFPLVAIRLPFSPGIEQRVLDLARSGHGIFHLYARENGAEHHADTPRFITDLIRSVHLLLVRERIRDQVTLIASGGIIAAEHLPKAIICGADLVALTTPLLVALQGEPEEGGTVRLPPLRLADPEVRSWGIQRLVNLAGAWHSQLLEILGAMGMREVRRLRGETGRAMFADELDREVFGKMFSST